MRLRFAAMICSPALCLFTTVPAFAQDEYHQLTVSDFRGRPHATGDAIAYTHCSIDYKYHVKGENNHYHLTFDVHMMLDKDQSWLDKKRVTSPEMLEAVLRHEQGHYTIAYMEQQEILREANRTNFDVNYQAEASALFNRIHAKYEELNTNYDEGTHHMLDYAQQQSWNVYFQRRLAYMPPVARIGY